MAKELWVKIKEAYNAEGKRVYDHSEWLGLLVIKNRIFDYDNGTNWYSFDGYDLDSEYGFTYLLTDGSITRLKKALNEA